MWKKLVRSPFKLVKILFFRKLLQEDFEESQHSMNESCNFLHLFRLVRYLTTKLTYSSLLEPQIRPYTVYNLQGFF